MTAISKFGSFDQKSILNKIKSGRPVILSHEPIELADSWGVEEELWDRNWSTLSGGEMQRIALAIAVGMKTAEILLLDGKCGRTLLCECLTQPLFRTNFSSGSRYFFQR